MCDDNESARVCESGELFTALTGFPSLMFYSITAHNHKTHCVKGSPKLLFVAQGVEILVLHLKTVWSALYVTSVQIFILLVLL